MGFGHAFHSGVVRLAGYARGTDAAGGDSPAESLANRIMIHRAGFVMAQSRGDLRHDCQQKSPASLPGFLS
ncbi:MAG TPA: hypothetical protein VNR39_04285 [Pseudolabrys sp.]|nr:hypothetical protein [Pseudolabrys sp.]